MGIKVENPTHGYPLRTLPHSAGSWGFFTYQIISIGQTIQDPARRVSRSLQGCIPKTNKLLSATSFITNSQWSFHTVPCFPGRVSCQLDSSFDLFGRRVSVGCSVCHLRRLHASLWEAPSHTVPVPPRGIRSRHPHSPNINDHRWCPKQAAVSSLVHKLCRQPIIQVWPKNGIPKVDSGRRAA